MKNTVIEKEVEKKECTSDTKDMHDEEQHRNKIDEQLNHQKDKVIDKSIKEEAKPEGMNAIRVRHA